MTLLQKNGRTDEKVEDYPQDRAKELRVESLLCRLKYRNTLPELPFDPKFLAYPLEPSRFLQYVATSLERNYKHELLTETDVGVDVDLIDPDVFKIDKSVKLHPDDERLLEDDTPAAINARKSRHQKSVSWLRRTEYISTEMYNRWNKSDKVESKLGYSVKRHLNEEIVYRDRESQIAAIEATFRAAKKPITKHYSKPNVHAVEVLPVLPDFTLWRYPCAQVIFDDDPARKNKSNAEQKEEVNQAMIRGMVDESGDHFVAYFLPTESTKQLRRLDIENHVPYTEGAAYEYELAREYNWNVKNKTMANYEENYFFVFRKDGVFYNELETRVRLSKRRKLTQSGSFMTGGGGGGGALPAPKTRLIVHHRDFTDEELKAQTDRLYMLEHDVEDEEEEDEDEEEEDGAHRAHERSGDTEHGSPSEGHSEACEDELHNPADNDAQEEDTDEFRETQSEGSEVEEVPARSSHSAKKSMAKRSPSEDEEEEEQDVEEEDEEDEEDDDLADSPPPVSPPQRSRRPSATGSGSASKKSAAPAKSRHAKKALVSDDDFTDTDDEEVPNKPSKTHKPASGQRTTAPPVKTSQVFDSDDEDESDLSDLSD
ncbi:RNA polymerase-associated factor [Clonorchis sinensis]|uniref:RNA polymerase II-associated factor 1 homolog n=1 Tax=Clonorchis sinensis TaxID=79923 RepID=A0A8T1M2W1_CLOSI|nr:RNA polymerase-associated factor [Clonorchis sinensis]